MPAILEGWLLGQAGGGAIADVLYGDVNPSAKLTETIPLRLEDTPAFLDFPGEVSHVRYGEGLFVGYRWYDARRLDVAFPFGHGLSYTTFAYGDATAPSPDGDVEVRVTVTNTGDRAGREVVQVYTALPGGAIQRPERELKAFASVALEAGESREVVLTVRRKDLAYWDVRIDRLGRRGRRLHGRRRRVEPRHPLDRDGRDRGGRRSRCPPLKHVVARRGHGAPGRRARSCRRRWRR